MVEVDADPWSSPPDGLAGRPLGAACPVCQHEASRTASRVRWRRAAPALDAAHGAVPSEHRNADPGGALAQSTDHGCEISGLQAVLAQEGCPLRALAGIGAEGVA